MFQKSGSQESEWYKNLCKPKKIKQSGPIKKLEKERGNGMRNGRGGEGNGGGRQGTFRDFWENLTKYIRYYWNNFLSCEKC